MSTGTDTFYLRIPAWVTSPNISVAVQQVASSSSHTPHDNVDVVANNRDASDGKQHRGRGVAMQHIAFGLPGTYLKLPGGWTHGDRITFALPVKLRSIMYTGKTTIKAYGAVTCSFEVVLTRRTIDLHVCCLSQAYCSALAPTSRPLQVATLPVSTAC
jgi:hypothetical protein